jgi:membrane-bound lytic murein transglycosylase B
MTKLLAIIGSAAALAAPPPSKPVPDGPSAIARALARTTVELNAAIDRWRVRGTRGRTPADVTLYALYQQRIYRLLSRDPRLARATIARLPAWLAPQARDTIGARRSLRRLTPPTNRRLRTGPARPAGVLLRYYLKGERRFGVRWQMLAAVNFVESAFGRVRSSSSAGARGPMQFIPSTWRAYGLGGDVHDPHDAILGAANYLRASGAPRQPWRALYRYNPSRLYVEAVLRYTRQITRDPRAFYAFYAWQVFVRTPTGDRRLTGPGVPP